MGGGGTGGAGPSAAPLLGSRLATARRAPGVRPTFRGELAGRPGTPGTSGHLLAAVGDMELAASWAAGAFVELLPGLRDGCYPGLSRGVLRPEKGAFLVADDTCVTEQDLEITSVKKKGLMEVNTTTHR
ncbi:Procollagen Galactosyltransferase 2 [Manis pentadactyla]|nr:Procollagen Galactosyltransferase 2 [Manis pentadactyla]